MENKIIKTKKIFFIFVFYSIELNIYWLGSKISTVKPYDEG
jgi:hypothetical protein